MDTTEPVCVRDFEEIADIKLTKYARDYFNSGANYEESYKDNCQAFRRYRIRPRYMRDVSGRCTQTTILGQEVTCPIGVSPMAMCRLAHPDGEVAIAQGLEEISVEAPNGFRWFQIHILSDRKLLLQLVRMAERHGFTALALTVDCHVHGRRFAEMRNKFTLPQPYRLSVLESIKSQAGASSDLLKQGWDRFVNNIFSDSATWDDLRWLKTVTKLPVVVKGLITGEGAREAVAAGADAVWVSNHGGRELDCVPASIDALGEVVEAVGGRCEVYLDGGVRSGLDVLKALALGARAVFVGRPLLWGLAAQGREGAEKVLSLLGEELTVGMALAGASRISEITRDLIVHESYYKAKL